MVVSTNSNVPAAAEDADGDAARRAPEREPGRAAERARRHRRGPRRRGAVHPPGREARAVRGPQPPDGLRPGRVHPLQPLRPLHAGGDAVLGALARGARAEARIVPTWGRSWLDTECELCGGCLSTCPTGAIYEKFLEGSGVEERSASRKSKTTCTFCGVGCQIDLNVDPETKRIVKVTSEPELRLERRQPLREGPLRLQLRPPPGPPDRAARPRRGRGTAPRRPGSTRFRPRPRA